MTFFLPLNALVRPSEGIVGEIPEAAHDGHQSKHKFLGVRDIAKLIRMREVGGLTRGAA